MLNDIIANYLSNNIVDDEWYFNDENDCEVFLCDIFLRILITFRAICEVA